MWVSSSRSSGVSMTEPLQVALWRKQTLFSQLDFGHSRWIASEVGQAVQHGAWHFDGIRRVRGRVGNHALPQDTAHCGRHRQVVRLKPRRYAQSGLGTLKVMPE